MAFLAPLEERAAVDDASATPLRQIPVGVSDTHNQVFRSRRYVYAIRFVVDRRTRIWRFLSGFNLEGLPPVGGRSGYTDGDGGRIQARLVAVDERGLPNMKRVLARETVTPTTRYSESAVAFGVTNRSMLLYFNMGGVQLEPGRMYAMTYRNVASRPREDWFSTNSPVVKASEAGPNATNTLDRDAPGAIAGLDPREAVAWSTNGGRRWVWGRKVGRGNTYGSYPGSRRGDGGVRLPWYGWQTDPVSPPQSNQPYIAYEQSGSYTLTLSDAPRTVTLTEAGGYAPVGRSVGEVTVTNLRNGDRGRTRELGSGITSGRLRPPVRVARGDGYQIANDGTVFKAEGDVFLQGIFGVGSLSGRFPFRTEGYEADRAELFALPHPWFGLR